MNARLFMTVRAGSRGYSHSVDKASQDSEGRNAVVHMRSPLHELPAEIVLSREEYRLQHAALEVALDVLDRLPAADGSGAARRQIEAALRMLLRRIWPYPDELDGE